nr:MAG TPA: hypothetical protein [Caudoviricetes sp.]
MRIYRLQGNRRRNTSGVAERAWRASRDGFL